MLCARRYQEQQHGRSGLSMELYEYSKLQLKVGVGSGKVPAQYANDSWDFEMEPTILSWLVHEGLLEPET